MRPRPPRPWDLYATAALALVSVLVALALPWPPLRVPLGLAFILVAPGYALVAALFPERRRAETVADAGAARGLSGLERAALSLGMSIAVVPLLGLALNYTPWGIRLVPVLLTLAAFTLGMSALAIWRRARLPATQQPRLALRVPLPDWRAMTGLDKALAVGVVLAILVAGSAVAYVALAPRPGERFTEFYVLGPGGKAEGYPSELARGANATVIVGVVNHEGEPVSYLVRASWIAGNVSANETGAETFAESSRTPFSALGFPTAPGEALEQDLAFRAPSSPGRYRLELELFRPGDDAAYRSLHLWLTVT